MKQLTWLAAERRLCGDADSEEDLSQEEEEEDEEDGNTKGEESREEGGNEARGDEDIIPGEEATRGEVGRGPARGRGTLTFSSYIRLKYIFWLLIPNFFLIAI